MLTWKPGRQGGAYENAKLFSFWRVDCYLIRFKAGYQLAVHEDKVEGFRHYRLNIRLYGEDAYQGASIFKFWRLTLFRSDQPHGTAMLTRDRMLLSFGWIIKANKEKS